MGHCNIVAITEGLPEHETSYRAFQLQYDAISI
jgi:hypothetical protein